jgi:phage gpG-like protein
MITYKIDEGQLRSLMNKLDKTKFQSAVDIALQRIGLAMEKTAHDRAPYKTGNLRGSIISEQTKDSVMTGTDLVYAKIHEFGGTITPKKGNFLRFQIDGQWIMARSVTISKKPYLTPAFEEQKSGKAFDIITQEITRIL